MQQTDPSGAKCDTKTGGAAVSSAALSFPSLSDARTDGRTTGSPPLVFPLSINAAVEAAQPHSLGASEAVARARAHSILPARSLLFRRPLPAAAAALQPER